MSDSASGTGPTVVVIGGGFSGSLFALKFARARPEAHVILVERSRRVGPGLAYGACAPEHLLNVPVARVEVGLEPGFADWLRLRPELLGEALAESGGDLAGAFVPRELFGAYLEERVKAAASPVRGPGFNIVRGEVVRLLDFPARGVLLGDGREIAADLIVLATGNLPPRPPAAKDGWLYDTQLFVPDPWAEDAFDGLAPDAPVVLLGTGLTMVDIALKLSAAGHTGPMLAVSRRGLLPLAHRAGGRWDAVYDAADHVSPRALMRRLRDDASLAEARGVPWQRVMDAMRPAVARVWHGWTEADRRLFLRHLRPRWDVHRHRMAPRVAAKLAGLIADGQLRVMGGRILGYRAVDDRVEVTAAERGNGTQHVLRAARVVNCTGPRTDMDRLAFPLLADLRRRGLIAPDSLGLGIETRECAALGSAGHTSPWLYALGTLTRSAWWEVIAVAEINTQIDRLVRDLSSPRGPGVPPAPSLAQSFADLGSGI